MFPLNATLPVLRAAIRQTTLNRVLRSGATATCAMLIPYEWVLQTLTDRVTLSVSVSALTRVHTRQLATFVVPSNGVTTSFTFVGRL